MNRRLLGMLTTALAFCITLSCSDKSTDITGIAVNDSTAAPLAVTVAVNPGTVTDLHASANGSTSVTLSFTQVNDGTGQPAKYDVRYAVAPISWGSATAQTSGTCNTPVAGTATGSQLSCTVLGLTPATNYSFQLVAFRGTLNLNAVFGSLSNIVSATTTASAPPPPAPVASVSVSPALSNLQIGATVQLLVTARDANDSVLTGRTVTSSSADAAIASVNSLGLVTAVSAGTTQITVASEGKSAVATIIVSAPAPPPAVNPGTVTDLQASANGSTSVTLSFTQVNDGTGQPAKYDVRYAVAPISWGSATSTTSGTCKTPVAGTAIGSRLSCTVLGLTPATNYSFQLVAFRGTLNLNAVFGNLSNIVSTTTTGSTAPPPPPPSGNLNEPSGMTVLAQRPFNARNESPMWIDALGGNATFISDPTAPRSPNGVLRATYPAGFVGGSSPVGNSYVYWGPTPKRTLYTAIWFRFSPNFYGHQSNVNKLAYYYTPAVSGLFVLVANGAGMNPLYPEIRFQNTISDGTSNLAPNLVPGATIPRGQWNLIEVLAVGNTAGRADGSIDVYLNGVHVTHKTMQWETGNSTWGYFYYYPDWGGGGGTVPYDMWLDWDHAYLSVK